MDSIGQSPPVVRGRSTTATMETRYTIDVPADQPEYRGVFISFYALCSAIGRAEIQMARIESDRAKLDLGTLFADIQFFLVSASNIQKMLLRLRKILPKNIGYVVLYKTSIGEMDKLDHFRDHLEHFDERLDGLGKKGQPLPQPNMLGNLLGDEYDFGGERFNLRNAFRTIERLKEDLIAWNAKNYKLPIFP